MNEYYEQNKRSLILLASMLFVLALVLFFMLLRPLLVDYEKEVHQIDSLNEEITLLETQIESLQETSDDFNVDQLILENKIPTERELDEYILALQQLELHTESKIETIQFTYDSNITTDEPIEEEISDVDANDESEVSTVNPTDEEVANADVYDDDDFPDDVEETEQNESEEVDEISEPTIDPVILSEKPDQLHVMTVRISVASPDFDEFIELLKLIETSERISIVTNLEFTKPTEQDLYFGDGPSEEVPFDAEITTFYYKE